jgi:hypothetical protein
MAAPTSFESSFFLLYQLVQRARCTELCLTEASPSKFYEEGAMRK